VHPCRFQLCVKPKHAELMATKWVVQFFKENAFARFDTPHDIISDGGKHFCNQVFKKLMLKYFVIHKIATPYHPQTSGQVEIPIERQKNFRNDG